MFLQNVLAYSGTNVISQVSRFIQEFVIRRIVPPELLGVWNFSLVVQEFAGSFEVGIIDAASRELPVLHGSGRTEEEIRTRSTAFWSKVAQSLLCAIVIVFYLLVYWSHYEALYIAALGSASLLVALGAIRDSFIPFHQNNQKYIPLSKVLLLSSLWYAFTLPMGALLGGIVGLIVAALVSFILQAVLIYHSAVREKLWVRKTWELRIFKRLISFGLPLRLADYPQQLFSMLDVLFVAKFMSVESLAIYSTAKAIFLQAQEVLARMGNVFIMRILNLSGQNTNRAVLAGDLLKLLLVSYLILIPLIILAVINVFSFLVLHLIPQYSPSIPVVKAMMFALYFTPQTTLVRSFWIMDERLVSIGAANIVGLLATAASLYLGTAIKGSVMEVIAFCGVVGYGIYFFYMVLSVGTEIWGLKRALGLIFYVLLSVAYTAVILFVVGEVSMDKGMLSGLQASGFAFMRSALFLSPLVYLGLWRSKSLAFFKSGLSAR